MIAALVVGIIFTAWRFKKRGNLVSPMAWLGAVAGITFVGTAATTLYQMLAAATHVAVGAEALITLIFAIIPLALGLTAIRLSLKNSHKASAKKRIYYVILGVAALFMWAGLIIGPILAIVASIVPSNLKEKE
jgi:magnesium-transporting ATPase (P-type)